MSDRYKEIWVGGKLVGRKLISQAPLPIPTTTKMTLGAFLDRFPGTSHAELVELAKYDPLIAAAKHKLDVSRYVDVADPQTKLFIGYMQSIGRLTIDEANEILSPIPCNVVGAIP